MASSSLEAVPCGRTHPKVEADVSFSTQRPTHERSGAAHLTRELDDPRVIKPLGWRLDRPPRVSDREELPVNDGCTRLYASRPTIRARAVRAVRATKPGMEAAPPIGRWGE